MKSLVVVFILVTPLLGQTVGTKDAPVTVVAGESWLNHLHRPLEETSMGKTGRLGPALPTREEEISGWQRGLSAAFPTQTVTLLGSDLYRLNCRGCHGESGLGAPPEINSVINPTRATSVAVTMERMKKLGMNINRAEAAELALQSRNALLQRVHNGGADMPRFPHLNGPEVRAIVAYLNELADVPGAEREQVAVEESPVHVGEHIVKSTCHICHNAAGANPNSDQVLSGAIPPLSTLTTRTSLAEFVRKVRNGAPIAMGTPPLPSRGRMPVFYYISENEAADIYLYLTLYPPYTGAVLDPAMPAPQQDQAASNVAPFVMDIEPMKALRPSQSAEMKIVLPIVVELFATLLLAGALGFTVREFRRLSAKSKGHNVLAIGGVNVPLDVTHSVPSEIRRQHSPRLNELAVDDNTAAAVSGDDQKAVNYSRLHHSDYCTFETAWLARQLENEDWVA